MKAHRLPLAAALAAVFSLAALSAQAQPRGPQHGPAHAAPQQGPAGHWAAAPQLQGQVSRLLINPFGEVDGLRLADGKLVKFPPHMGEEVAAAVQPGQVIGVSGRPEGYGSVKAYAITNTRTGQTVIDPGPPHHRGIFKAPPHLRMQSLQAMQAEGRIETVLTGKRGEANGVLLDSGSIVRFPPHSLRLPLQAGQPFAAAGMGTTNRHGSALEAMSIGSSLAALQPLYGGVLR